jgi:undecaprenyl-diphosphatase
MLFGTETFELEILKSIQNIFGCGFMDFLMPQITKIGNFGAVWIVIGIILICTKKYRKSGVMLLCGLLLGFIFGNLFLKNVIARPRPCWINDTFPLLIAVPHDFSFPSGHTLSSFISAFTLWNTDRRFGYGAFAAALIIAFSRLYLFVHFPTDILGGILLAFIIHLTVKNIFSKKKNR